MRTHQTKLWQTLLGALVVSGLACGGSSGGGSGNDGGGFDGGPATIDTVSNSVVDLAMPSIDQAGPTIDQAGPRIDQAGPAVDLGTTKRDGGSDADARVPDAQPDVPMQPDLPWGPEVTAKTDLPPSQPDLPITRDLPPAKDLPPALEVGVTVDVAGKLDLPPALDTSAGLDVTALDTGIDTDPTAPVVTPNKLTYGPGEAITATYANGSTDSEAWIGIFAVGMPDSAGMERDWKYTSGQAASTMLLHVPGTPGTYELRMYLDIGYVRIATSVPFAVVAP